jgi:N-dimethylarginine dimethylaminohydrolase
MNSSPAATYGGPGWRPRIDDHSRDVQEGFVWHHCGVSSEVAPLREVLLVLPDSDITHDGDPDQQLFLDWPDPARLRGQAQSIAALYEQHQIQVHWAAPSRYHPNWIFQRDLFFMTPEGAALARPASVQRAPEARFAAERLASLGVPIIATPRRDALFEGADALWFNETTVLLGHGLRTNLAGVEFVTAVLKDQGVHTIVCSIPEGIQHLLGVINFVDVDLAVVRRGALRGGLAQFLQDSNTEVIEFSPEECAWGPFGMNFVTLSPRTVLLQKGCRVIAGQLAAAGVQVHEIDASEYTRAAGGLGCLTGVIARSATKVGVPNGPTQKLDLLPDPRTSFP